VITTFLVAVMVPNVQALISLVGALAGSSTALLIPPMLELAWIEQKQTDPMPTAAAAIVVNDNDQHKKSCFGIVRVPKVPAYWFEKTKCYVLLLLGFVFFFVGTYSSVMDIVRIYQSGH
jgi:proton-coupled amino acid transporter